MITASSSRSAAAALGIVAAVGGAVSFAGWLLGVPRLASWQGDALAMQPNACMAMFLSGVALALVPHRAHRSIAALGTAVALIGGLTLLQHLTGLSLGIDQLFTYGRDWSVGTSSPGRMGPPGSFSFTLIGAALMLLGLTREPPAPSGRRTLVPVLALIVGTLALFSIIGYAFGAQRFYAVPWLTAIALQSALLLIVVAVGLILAVPEHEPVRTLFARSGAASLARFVIPLLVVLPIALGALFIEGERWELYDTRTGLAIRTLLFIVIGVGLMWLALTALRRGEERERRANQRIADFVGSITDGFYAVDRAWRVVFSNDEAARRMGGAGRAVGSAPLWELLPTLAAQARPRLEHAMSARTSVEYEVHEPALGRWFHEKAFPTADGGLAIYAQDVTDRKRVEAIAEERRKLLQFTIDGTPAVIYIKDAEGRQLMVNERFCQLVGRPREELIGRTDAEIFPRESLAHIRENDRRVFAENRAMEFEEWLDLPDGRHQYLSTKVPADAVGFPGRVLVGISLDITERKRAQDALREADRRKDEFLATLSHELRNPLAPIGNAVEILCRPGATEHSIAWARQVLQRQVRTMGLLLDDLLDLSRITQGKLQLKKKATRLNSIIDAAVETARPMLDAKRHALSVSLPDVPVQLLADPLRLSQVLANLLNNAAKYTEAGGQIAVEGVVSGDEVRIAVRDTGAGLAAGELSRIFDMFSQGNAASKAEGGLGIGLALARGILKMHGGRLEAFSDGPGHGSTFVVTLPLLEAEPVADIAEARSEASMRLRRVLVADDNKDGAESLAMLLQMDGHEVRVAFDGSSALAIASVFQPDVALLDIGMPELSGDQVAARIREQAWSANTVLVAITGWGQEEDRVKTLAAGFDRHLTKPVDFEQLRRILAEERTATAKVIALDRGKVLQGS